MKGLFGFFVLFHSTRNSKILFLGVMLAVLPPFHPQVETHWMTLPTQIISVSLFVLFMRFDPKTWIQRRAAKYS